VIKQRDASISTLETVIKQRDASISTLEDGVKESNASLSKIYASRGWKVLLAYYKLRDKFRNIFFCCI
jgi:hypothetical protein